jgi:hypothetical protein
LIREMAHTKAEQINFGAFPLSFQSMGL